ncbi:MAG: 3-deoxy-manno-octulosonate cytidylyltransferase [Pseudomonadales bacterium]|nr:3-deoxy-manno-octulosonate cytidylyltransferase [Pseudomonadales bacterium]
MSFIVVIPSRFASTRLPGKPLLDIAGIPMIQHVWLQALKSDASEVIIATDNAEIEKIAIGFGATVCMTSTSHESGTDRLQEVVQKMALPDDQVIINVQGDEPLIPPAVINQLAVLMQDEKQDMATLCEAVDSVDQLFDANVVKLVTDEQGQALYFSRAPIPWVRDVFAEGKPDVLPSGVAFKRHIGIYGYRAKLLNQFVQWPVAPLEAAEKLEQLRAMANGVSIAVDEACETIPGGVDTEADLALVRAILTPA